MTEFPRTRDYLAPRYVGDVFFFFYIIFGQEVPKKRGKHIVVVFLVELHVVISSSDSTISLPVSLARAAVSKMLSRYFCGTSSLSADNTLPRLSFSIRRSPISFRTPYGKPSRSLMVLMMSSHRSFAGA